MGYSKTNYLRLFVSLLFVVLISACGSGEDSDSDPPPDPPPQNPGGSGSGPTDDGSGDSGSDASEDSGDDTEEDSPALTSGACVADGMCSWPETYNSCPADCDSFAIEEYSSQQARYIDGDCEFNGDGTTDTCADSAGAAGRFNDLQAALESLNPGYTLYIHPGEYWQEPFSPRDSGGVFVLPGENDDGNSSADEPIILTAANPDAPPLIHSFDPTEQSDSSAAALTINRDHVIVDNLAIRGRLQVWGVTGGRVQNVECTHGWGTCSDGNWACLRVEASENVVVHHNNVHDLSGAGECESCAGDQVQACLDNPRPDRGSGLKEFTSNRIIWEFNTVRDAPYWGYDHHRNSEEITVRYNRFDNIGTHGIHSDRGRNHYLYGNIILSSGNCIEASMLNEDVSAQPHEDSILNNTCLLSQWGVTTDQDFSVTVLNNLFHRLGEGNDRGHPPRNMVAPGNSHEISYNAYDSDADYHSQYYDGGRYRSLSEWQDASGYDAQSSEAPDGFCELVDPPASVTDIQYDAHVVTEECTTMSDSQGEVGAYGVTTCVGHECQVSEQ